ncbi:hypothetical protein ACFL3G_13135, partial [Planctomycetota bacterium]
RSSMPMTAICISMAKKIKNMLRNKMVVCVLVLVAIGLTSVVFGADFKIKEGAIEEGIVFGDWTATDSNSDAFSRIGVYKASTDGFVVAWSENPVSQTYIQAYTDSSNPPTTIRSKNHADDGQAGITLPVKKDDYWKITVQPTSDHTIYWIPLGDGGAPERQ